MHLPESPIFKNSLAGASGLVLMSVPGQSNLQTITFETSEGSENTWLQNQEKSAVISLVTSRFDYCNGLLCGIPEELIRKLQRVQNNAARVITLTKKHDHITPVLKDLHWLPVRKRIEFKILLLAYKCLQGTAPSYLRELLKEYVPPRTLRSTSKNLLCEPRNNMKTYDDRSFSACAPKLWNQLPDNIRAAGSVAIFKRQLKTHLFKDVYIN